MSLDAILQYRTSFNGSGKGVDSFDAATQTLLVLPAPPTSHLSTTSSSVSRLLGAGWQHVSSPLTNEGSSQERRRKGRRE